MTVLPLEEVACQVAVDADDPAGGTLRPETKAAIENAESDAETVDRRRVRCTEEEARDLVPSSVRRINSAAWAHEVDRS